jgi:hypothetical protein
MQRRDFLQASAAGGLLSLPALAAAQEPSDGREFFELRSYSLRPGKRELLDGYFQRALLPALGRLRAASTGVFYENADSDKPIAWLLLRHNSPADLLALSAKLNGDAQYLAAAAEYLAAPATDAVYDRIESSILAGIDGLPRLVAPPRTPRLFNLRIYESHNEAAALKKIEMFNKGELAIFKRVGLTPVLFGQALAGPRLPNLTYLLVYPDDAARQAAWNTFRADPEWQKLRAIPEYEDKRIVSKITNKLLTPADYSQI